MKKQYLFILLGLLIASPAHSAIQTITGSNFDLFYDKTKLGLFGAPSLAGNNIFLHQIILRLSHLTVVVL